MPSGILGFDELTGGGLPRRRVTVVMGGAGSGKTIFGLQVLANGALLHDEKGLLVSFEQSVEQLAQDCAAFEWASVLRENGPVEILDARLSQTIAQGGDFDLLGLLAVMGAKLKMSGARRLVLDGLDVLLAHLGSAQAVRREVYRLREWLDASDLTVILTAKAYDSVSATSKDYDFLQFMADCVVMLRHTVVNGTALRDLRVSKLRGAAHSANEIPFTISKYGIEVASGGPGELDYPASSERVSSGVERLDTMLDGGYYRGSSVLITGAPGSAKTTLAAAFAQACCARGERTIYLSFDEGPRQVIRNMAAVGIDFKSPAASGLLRMVSLRARSGSPEAHVATVRALVREHAPQNLVIDPLSALACGCGGELGEDAAIQILDIAKSRGITTVSSSLLGNALPLSEESPIGISTIADTWMHLSYVSSGGERNRALTIIKSRGTAHSNQVRELLLTDAGIHLAEVYTVGGEVLMGTLRWERENDLKRAEEASGRARDLREREAEVALAEARARLDAIARDIEVRERDLEQVRHERRLDTGRSVSSGDELRRLRGADASEDPSEVEAPR